MNKKYYYTALVVFLLLAAGIQPARAIVWELEKGETYPFGDWDSGSTTFTLTRSLDLGDSIKIIDDHLTLDGAGWTVSSTSGLGHGVLVEGRYFVGGKSYVTIKNLNVTGWGYGIYLDGSSNNNMENNTVSAIDIGIYIKNSRYNNVQYNAVSDCVTGIHLHDSSNNSWPDSYDNSVIYNTVERCDVGISLARSDNNTVTYNTVTGDTHSTAGIRLSTGAGDNDVRNNTISNIVSSGSGYGIEAVDCYGDNPLIDNTISNSRIGIRLFKSHYLSITANDVFENTGWGIHLEQSDNNVLTDNNVSDNASGIWLYMNSDYNTIYNNYFTDNTPDQAVVSEDSSGNVFNLAAQDGGGNYWSDWGPPHTYDLNNDGFWDDPYVIVPANLVQDNLPLVGNQRPIADAGDDQEVECACNTSEGTKVTLYGAGSDPDEDPLTYAWTGPFDGGSTNEQNPTVTLDPGCLGDYVISLVVYDGELYSDPDTVTITVVDTMPPYTSCPGDITIEAMDPDGVPADDPEIQMFLADASATDDCDPSPVISHDAPPVFLPGETMVTFMAADQSGNSSTCQWTVTVTETGPVEAIEDIIGHIEGMEVPEAEKELNKAAKELNKAIKELNKDKPDKAIKKIEKAIKQLEKAQKKCDDTEDIEDIEDIIDGLLALIDEL